MTDLNNDASKLSIDEISDKELDKVVGGAAKVTFNTQQVLNIGSKSSGAGAGKITFNPF